MLHKTSHVSRCSTPVFHHGTKIPIQLPPFEYSYSRNPPRFCPPIDEIFPNLPLSREHARADSNAMTRKDAVKHDYHSQAGTYDDYMSSPIGVIEGQLFTAALGDCRGLTVLDLGGGTGRKQHLVFLSVALSARILPLFSGSPIPYPRVPQNTHPTNTPAP